jgi:hypothetical protein
MTYGALVKSAPNLIAYIPGDSINSGYPVFDYFAPSVTANGITTRTGEVQLEAISRDSRDYSITYSVQLPDAPDWLRVNLPDTTYTSYAIEFWANINTNLNPSLLNDDNGIVYDTQVTDSTDTTREAKFYIRVNDAHFNIYDTGTLKSATAPRPTENSWHHYVFEIDNVSKQAKLFIDGVLSATLPYSNMAPIRYWYPYGGINSFQSINSWSRGVLIQDWAFYATNDGTRSVTDEDILERYNYLEPAIRYFNGSSWQESLGQKVWVENPTRYIRWSAKGNTLNSATHFNELEAFSNNGINVALGTTPTIIQGDLQTANPLTNLTDGGTGNSGYIGFSSALRVIIEFDLGQEYDIDYIQFHHYYSAGRSYLDVKIEISADGINWKTIYDEPLTVSEVQGGTSTPQIGNGWVDWSFYGPVTTWNGSEWVNI